MHNKQAFDSYPIMDHLMQFADDFDFPTWSKHNLIEIQATIDEIEKVIKDEYKDDKYKFRFTPTWNSQDGVNLDSAKFTVSLVFPSPKPTVAKYIKKTFSINADIYFFDNFLMNMGKFFVDYDHALMLQDNLDEFNAAIRYVVGWRKSITDAKAELGSELKRFDSMDFLYKNRHFLPLISEMLTGFADSLETYSKKKHKVLKDYVISKLTEKVSDYGLFTFYNKMGTKKFDVNLSESLDLVNEVLQGALNALFEVEKKRDQISISFALGDKPLIKSSETYAEFGLTEDVIKNLGSLPLFNEYMSGLYNKELREGEYWNYVLDALGIDDSGNYTDTKVDKSGKVVKRLPYEFLHVDNPFVRGLNLYFRPNIKEKTLKSIKYKEDKPDNDFEDFDMENDIDVDEYLAGLEDDEIESEE